MTISIARRRLLRDCRRVLTTEGTLLGGRVRYRQPAQGFRSGIEPVLLAAAIPARAGERVLEAGTGAGPAMLCLSARVPGCAVTGVEIDPALAGLAAENATDNGFSACLRHHRATSLIMTFSVPFDHAMANPPYHSPTSSPFGRSRSASSPSAGRRR